MLRKTLFKRKKPLLKKSFLKKKVREIDSEAIEKMRNFFFALWNVRPHYCFICGTSLGREPRTYNFHHVIPKQKQKNYTIDITYDEKNIILVCLDCHTNIENGFLPTSLLEKKNALFEYYNEWKVM